MINKFLRNPQTGAVIKNDKGTEAGAGSIMTYLRMRPGLRAFIHEQARFEKIKPYQLMRRAIRAYLKHVMLKENAFFDYHGYNLDEQEYAKDLRREIRMCEIENQIIFNKKTPEEVRQLYADLELLTIEVQKSVPPERRMLAFRMRERICYELGGRRHVLAANGYNYRSYSYLVRAMGEGVFPWHRDFESVNDFVFREIDAGPEALGYPDERYAAEDARRAVTYADGKGEAVPDTSWAARPFPEYPQVTLTEKAYNAIFVDPFTPRRDLEYDTNYDPTGRISQG